MNRQLYRLAHQHASKLVLAAAAATLWTLFETPAAQATPVQIGTGANRSYRFDFDTNSGPADTPPAGTAPWLTALISPIQPVDSVNPVYSGVVIELTSNLSDPDEFISSVGFNLKEVFTISAWTCSGDVACDDSDLLQADPLKQPPQLNFSNGIQGLDIGFSLPEAASSDRFQLRDKVTFSLTADGLSPESFVTTINPSGPLSAIYSAARVQGIGSGSGSTAITDPGIQSVPGPLPLLGAALALGYSRRLRRRLAGAEVLG